MPSSTPAVRSARGRDDFAPDHGKGFPIARKVEFVCGGVMSRSAGIGMGRVRSARMQEMDCVAALWVLVTEHHGSLDPLFRMRRGPVAEGELRELLGALFRDPDVDILIFDVEGTPQGLCIVRIDRAPPILEETERAEITDLGVRPAYRRRGIASRLVEEAQTWVRDRGVSRIEIQVAHGNIEGQSFWRSMGFGDLMDVLHKRL